ncbi:MAG: YDG domain-containing protein [Pseudomonadota bacterium]
MKSHASINRIYRLVWNAATGLWVAVAENVRGHSKGGSGRTVVDFSSAAGHVGGRSGGGGGGFDLKQTCRAALLLLVLGSHVMAPVHAADAAYAAVVAGSGSVATSGATTTITQGSQNLAIDWTSLSTRANEALVFNQPNAQAIALNRITGTSPSELLGSLTANGQVFILNPNGVLFGAGSQVNVGGLVASTLSMSNADFMAGNHVFTGSGGSASVVNQGSMTAASGGYLALLAPEVRNEGVMTASLGTALLAAGNKVTLNLDNGSLLGYSIEQGAVNALADNKQLIQADGGQVLLSAKAMDSLTTATVNNTGVIEARTIQNKAGRILLMGDMETGTVNVGGTLDASAASGGNGGFIETSAAHVKVASGTKVTTEAPGGKTGKWLIDPNNFTISATGDMDAATVAANLATTDFEIQTVTMGSAGSGDITVSDAVSWAGPTVFTLTAQRHVNINADISNTGSGAAGFVASGAGNINIASGVDIAATGSGSLAVNLSGASVNMASGSSIVTGGAAVTLAGSNTAVLDAVTLNAATINAGAGTVSITGNTTNGGSTTDWSARGIEATGSSISGGNITLKSTNAAIQLLGTSVASAGGDVLIDASGPSDTHSLEIAKNGATSSNVMTTGSGIMTLKGNLTAGGGEATGAASGVVVAGSTISAGNGAISISGDAGWTTTVDKEARGVLLASGATVTGAGNIGVTGRVGSGVPVAYSTVSAGLEVASGAKVQSTGGNLAVSGTFLNHAALNGKGVLVGGRLESGPAGSIAISGNATVGNSAGTGVEFRNTAVVKAGTLGLTVTGTGFSSTTVTALIGADINGTVSSTGDIAITGGIEAASATGATALRVTDGTVTAIGAGNVVLAGSGVPPPAPPGYYEVQNYGVITSGGGTITVTGDRVDIANTVNAGVTGRIVIAPHSTNRSIALGGGDEQNYLYLTNSELSNLTAATVQVGRSSNTGGIEVRGDISAPNFGTLSLLNSSTGGIFQPGITQSGGVITVNKLNADAWNVALTGNNAIGTLSGRSYAGNFAVNNGSTAMNIGTADGTVGVSSVTGAVSISGAGDINVVDALSTTGNVTLNSSGGNLNLKALSGAGVTLNAAAGAITDTNGTANNITATTLTASSANGITLDTDVSGKQTLSTTGAAGGISITTARAIDLTPASNAYAITTAAGTHQNVSLTTSNAAGITTGNAFEATDDNISLTATAGGINLSGDISAEGLSLSANGTITAPNDINVAGVFELKAGSLIQVNSTLQQFDADDFRITGGTFMRALAGDGLSTATAYQITDAFGLQGIGSTGMLGKHFKLANDIYAGGTNCWNACTGGFHGFKPIGDSAVNFTGTFDGNNKVISYLFINRTATSDVGLFGYTGAGSNIYNVGLTDVDITGSNAVGGLIGNSDGGSVSNSYVTGAVSGVSDVGGLVGDSSSTITNSYAGAAVTATGAGAGGLAGYTDGSITASYANGAVMAASGAGGLAGGNAGTVSSSFWDTTTSGQASSAGGTGRTTAQMMQAATFTGAGWSASNVGGDGSAWRIYEGQTGPLLRSFLTGLTLADTTLTYNGAIQSGVTSAAGVQGAASSGRNAGSYTGYYDDQQGYDIKGGALLINKASLTLAAVADSKTYDGTTSSAAAVSKTGLQGTDAVTGLTQSFGSRNAMGAGGSTLAIDAGYAVADGNGGNNYNLTVTGTTGTIDKANLTLSTSDVSRTYDGTTTAAGAVVASSGTVFGSDSVSGGNFAFTDKTASTGDKTVTVSGVTVNDGNGGNNYNITYASNTTSTISKATLNVVATPEDKVYDGTTAATIGLTDNRFAGDVITLSGVSDFASKDVGAGIAVTVGTLTPAGADAGNYNINVTMGVNTAAITPKTLTVTAHDDSRIFDNIAYRGGKGVSYSGFVAGEGASVLSGTLAYGGSSQGATAAGKYDITPGGLMGSNYALDFVEGTLRITAADAAAAALGKPELVNAYGAALQAVGSLGGGGDAGGGSVGGSGGGSGGAGNAAAAGGTDAGAALDAGTDPGSKD